MTKPFLRALQGETLSPPPIWLMRQAGRYLPEYRELRATAENFLDFCYTPEKAVEVTLQPLRRYHFDAAILFSDILVIPDALGQGVRFVKGEGPQLDAIETAEQFRSLDRDRVLAHLEPVFEVVRHLSQAIPRETALIGFAGAPWTVATYMVEGRGGTGFGKVLGMAKNDPDTFQILIDVLIEATAAYLAEQIKNGAEVIQLFDSWAGAFETAGDDDGYHRWVLEPNAAIIKRLKTDFPTVPVIGFPKGISNAALETFVRETHVDGISLGADVDLNFARDHLQPHCTVQGNLDNQLLVEGGEKMDRAIDHILETLGGGRFIFNLGHGILPETPPEHVARLIDRVRSGRG